MQYWIVATCLFTTTFMPFAAADAAPCRDAVTRASDVEVSPVRRRLSAFIPTLSLQFSDRLDQYDDSVTPFGPSAHAPAVVGNRENALGHTFDWRLSANWDVLAIARALTLDGEFALESDDASESSECSKPREESARRKHGVHLEEASR